MHRLDQNNMMQSFFNKIIHKKQIEAKLVKIAIVHNLLGFFLMVWSWLVICHGLFGPVRTSPYDTAVFKTLSYAVYQICYLHSVLGMYVFLGLAKIHMNQIRST